MRPIDADALMDEANSDGAYGYVDAKQISEAPTVDAIPVVKCRECKKHSEANGKHYCKFWRMYCPDDSDFFCKAGEQKEGAD